MSDDPKCETCGAPYGEGADCPDCKAVRRKDVVVRIVIGAMFIIPMLTVLAAMSGLLGGHLGGLAD